MSAAMRCDALRQGGEQTTQHGRTAAMRCGRDWHMHECAQAALRMDQPIANHWVLGELVVDLLLAMWGRKLDRVKEMGM